MASVNINQPQMFEKNSKYQSPFEAGKIYHIYNRANNQDLLFHKEKNYTYFLKRYNKYLSDYFETFAYCLLPNHFHLMVRIKHYPFSKEINKQVSEQLRRLFISYSQAINKQENRKGSLFQKPFKRKLIDDSSYFTQLILYIHLNPVHHNYKKHFSNYKWSSYQSILSTMPTKICRNDVIKWFGSKEKFMSYHTNYEKIEINQKLKIE